ncbi:MAG: hypothetical protein WCI79_00700 [Candidatus Saccharibacteria bacterium]
MATKNKEVIVEGEGGPVYKFYNRYHGSITGPEERFMTIEFETVPNNHEFCDGLKYALSRTNPHELSFKTSRGVEFKLRLLGARLADNDHKPLGGAIATRIIDDIKEGRQVYWGPVGYMWNFDAIIVSPSNALFNDQPLNYEQVVSGFYNSDNKKGWIKVRLA